QAPNQELLGGVLWPLFRPQMGSFSGSPVVVIPNRGALNKARWWRMPCHRSPFGVTVTIAEVVLVTRLSLPVRGAFSVFRSVVGRVGVSLGRGSLGASYIGVIRHARAIGRNKRATPVEFRARCAVARVLGVPRM